MNQIKIKDVLFEMTFQWDKDTAVQSIMFPDDNMSSDKCKKVIQSYDELYSIYGQDINITVDMVETMTEQGLDDNQRLKLITELVELKNLNHNLETVIA